MLPPSRLVPGARGSAHSWNSKWQLYPAWGMRLYGLGWGVGFGSEAGRRTSSHEGEGSSRAALPADSVDSSSCLNFLARAIVVLTQVIRETDTALPSGLCSQLVDQYESTTAVSACTRVLTCGSEKCPNVSRNRLDIWGSAFHPHLPVLSFHTCCLATVGRTIVWL